MDKRIPATFNRERILDGLHRAMEFGLPTRVEDRATFHFPRTATNTAAADEDQVPFDPSARPTVTRRAAKAVNCAVEFFDGTERIETFGGVRPTRISITLLDPEYQDVKGFAYVVAGGDKYVHSFTEPPVALGTIDTWTVWCTVEDER